MSKHYAVISVSNDEDGGCVSIKTFESYEEAVEYVDGEITNAIMYDPDSIDVEGATVNVKYNEWVNDVMYIVDLKVCDNYTFWWND